MNTLTIDRSSLSLADLVIGSNPFGTAHHIEEAGIRWPRVSMRSIYAPESEFIAGRVKLAQVEGVAEYPVTLYVHGDTTADVFANMDAVEAAVCQFEFDLTVTIDGQSRTYRAEGDIPDWGEVDSGMVRAHIAKGTVTFNLLRRVA